MAVLLQEYVAPAPPAGLADLLVAAFAEGPDAYDADRAADRARSWPAFRAAPGFSSRVACAGNELVGVVWGWVTPPDFEVGFFEELYAAIRGELGPAADELPGRAEVMVLAVHPDHRNDGVGSRLLQAFLGDRPGWLIAHGQRESLGWYTRRGWVRRGAAGAGSAYDVLTHR